MAKIEMNAITQHFRGKIGDLVFRRFGGLPMVALRPKPFTGPPTESQMEVRLLFKKAIAYAKAALADRSARSVYEEAAHAKGKPVFSTAVGDFFHPPVVQDIDLASFKGRIGDKIAIIADDDVAVVSVNVAIRNQASDIVEQGGAVLSNGKWLYTATTTLPSGEPATIEVTCKDRPGNVGTLQKDYTPEVTN